MRRLITRLFRPKAHAKAAEAEHLSIRQARIENIWHQVCVMEALRQYGKLLESGELDD